MSHPRAASVAKLPTERPAGCPFDPPTELERLREEAPLRRMTYPDGHLGWLATGHRTVRAILADRRFSSRYELKHYPFPEIAFETLPPAPPAELTGIDPPEHTRYRKLLTGKFTVRRMRQLTERVEHFAAERLDAMAANGPPADLLTEYARPVPALLICELLGVPYAERHRFQRNAELITGEAVSEDTMPAWQALQEFLGELIAAKRAEPTDDLLSDLVAIEELSEEELRTLGVVLLGAGLDTTANMLALGTFALLRNPEQLAELRADPSIIDRAVEELLRYLSIAHTDVRAALEDVEIDGQLIKAGKAPPFPPRPRIGIPNGSPMPSGSICAAVPPDISPSDTGSTSVSASSWHEWRCASPSRRCSTGSPRCGWPSSPMRCRCAPRRASTACGVSRSPGTPTEYQAQSRTGRLT